MTALIPQCPATYGTQPLPHYGAIQLRCWLAVDHAGAHCDAFGGWPPAPTTRFERHDG